MFKKPTLDIFNYLQDNTGEHVKISVACSKYPTLYYCVEVSILIMHSSVRF